MSHDSPELQRDVAVQREVARIALAGVDGFALAGSGAIREHGMIDRPTEDVDLFTTSQDVTEFAAAVDQVTEHLRGRGFSVDQVRRAPQFARLHVATSDGRQLDVDLGVDWRQDDPVRLDIGPVLSLADAVGNKVSALYSRGEPRDYLDLDAIRASGRFTDEQLVTAAAERDPGFEVDMFAQQLVGVRRLTPRDVRGYGVTADQLEDVKARCLQWASTLQKQPDSEQRGGLSSEELRGLIERRQAGFPTPATEATRPRSGPPAEATRRPTDPDRGIEL
ncbi:MAG: nucleotidyl transferase AbiEii/AbiGii toxin family protein [Microlunatus sp.]|nr:nucleotidyl transferase AbiEii/AbiGii toxin family protein [Microlunatus sp.]MDN5771772.1 nucleotidyl transferase AbiEii/AbiGii toxin family protein [Microlunatus sp.]